MSFLFDRFYCLFFLVFFSFCSDTKTEQKILREVNSALDESNRGFIQSNQDILYVLESRFNDAKAKERVAEWLPKAKKISAIAKRQLNYLLEIKEIITTSSKESELLSNKVFENYDGKQLYQEITGYWKDMLLVDSELKRDIGSEIDSINRLTLAFKNRAEFEQYYFDDITTQEALSFITKLQNATLRTEAKCLSYSLKRTEYINCLPYEVFEAIVGQNAQILKAGSQLEITAGLGSFSRNKLPTITIGNKLAELNEKGFAFYKFKTSDKTGKYSLPVKVAFIDQDGKAQERTFNVEYTLVEAIKKQ